MNATQDDARLLFGRWKEEAPALRVKLISQSLILEATGTVTEFTDVVLQVSGPTWQFTIPLPGVEYTFSDPREIPIASVRDAETAKYEFGLALKLAGGDRLVLMEIKAAEVEDVEED